MGFGNNYNNFFEFFKSDTFTCIIEIGSRDCLDSISMYKQFKPDKVYAFECNPRQINICEQNIKKYPNIHLEKYAIYEEDDKTLDFTVPTNYASDGGQGSLCGKARHEYWKKTNHSYGRIEQSGMKSKTIQVDTMRLDTFCIKNNIKKIDLMCIDVEGVPLSCIKSLSDKIKDVKYLISEVYFKEVFPNCDLYDNMSVYMETNGFVLKKLIKKNEWMGDALWVNNN